MSMVFQLSPLKSPAGIPYAVVPAPITGLPEAGCISLGGPTSIGLTPSRFPEPVMLPLTLGCPAPSALSKVMLLSHTSAKLTHSHSAVLLELRAELAIATLLTKML